MGGAQGAATGMLRPLHWGAAVEQRIVGLMVVLRAHGHGAPQHGGKRGGRDQHLVGGQALGTQSLFQYAAHMLLRQQAPAQVGRAQHQPGLVPAQALRVAQRRHHAHQQGQGVERVDDEHAAHAVGVVRERLQQLRAIDGQHIQQGVCQQRQGQGQPPAAPQLPLALQAGHQPAQRCAGQRQEKKGMALGPVAHHVEQWFAMVDEGVQVRQRSRRRAPQCGLPGSRAPPQGGKNDGAAQGSLADGVHGVSAGGRARLMRRILAALPQP